MWRVEIDSCHFEGHLLKRLRPGHITLSPPMPSVGRPPRGEVSREGGVVGVKGKANPSRKA